MIDRIDDAPLDDELATRFDRLGHLDVPDNWQRATDRALTPGGDTASTHRWWVAAAAAVLVVGGVIAVAATRGSAPPVQDSASSAAPDTPAAEPFVSEPANDDGASVPNPDLVPLGSATVEPSRASAGDVVTVTPNGVIQPTCTDLGAIYSYPIRLGVVGQNGSWTPGDGDVRVPACLPAETDEPMSYPIPEGLPVGVVSICRTIEFSDATCGPLEIVEAPSDETASVVMPVVEGLTEGGAIDILRALDLTVQVQRMEVPPGDPSDGRVINQSPAAAQQIDADGEVSITIGQATVGAEADELAQTLAGLGADLVDAPTAVTMLDGSTFCGSEQLGLDGLLYDSADIKGRRCFLDHHAARLPATFVQSSSTDEGDPIIVVLRTRADGTATVFIDSTRDRFGSGEWSSSECSRIVDLTSSTDPAFEFGCGSDLNAVGDPITVDPLPFPAWFKQRTPAADCGYFSSAADDAAPEETRLPLSCMAAAIEQGEPAELVTVHVGDELRVARWIVSLGPSPAGTEQFEVASLVVDQRAGTTRWAETRCVEGELIDGRLVGEYIVDREFVDQLDPSGTIVTETGEVLVEPGPDERTQLQACNGPLRVERPFVTPFEATGRRIGDVGPETERLPSFNELGEHDTSIAPSWEPVGTPESPAIIGFIPNDSLEFPPPPDSGEPYEPDRTLYADDGITRIGEFGPEGFAVLD